MEAVPDDNAGVDTSGAAINAKSDANQNAGSKSTQNEDPLSGPELKPANRHVIDQVINPESIDKLAETNPQSVETNIGRMAEGIETKPDDIKAVAENPAEELARMQQMFARFTDLSQKAQSYYTIDEVAEYDGKDQRPVFIIVEDTVYNITDFLPYHPGGKTVLLQYAGQDVTEEMRESPMPEIVFTTFLKLFQVGWIEEEETYSNEDGAYQ